MTSSSVESPLSLDRRPGVLEPGALEPVALEPGALELVPLGRMTVRLRKPFVLGRTSSGDRLIFEVESARFDGPRLSARAKGNANADWFIIGPDGTGTLDVRALMETDDGALIFVHYTGRVDPAAGLVGSLYSAPQFETGDDRYRWLNRIQAVGKGVSDGSALVYDVFELR